MTDKGADGQMLYVALDFTVIVNVRHQFGPNDTNIGVYAGNGASFPFDCPGASPADAALLLFQSRGVGVEQALSVNGVPVFGGVPATDVAGGFAGQVSSGQVEGHTHNVAVFNVGWVGNVMIVGSGVLQETNNELMVASSGDTFVVDNVVVLYKVESRGPVVAS